MLHKVGIVGANGNVGKAAKDHLLKHVEAGKIELVVFHRPGNKPADLPASVETIEMDLASDTVEQIVPKVKGIHVLIAALAPGAGANETNLVDAFAKSPDAVSYIPSIYTNEWSAEDRKSQPLGTVLGYFFAAADHAKSIGLGTTIVSTGAFAQWFWGMNFLGTDIKANELTLDEGQRKNRVPIVLMDHIGSVVADLAASSPESIKNTTHSVVTYQPTGDELINVFTKIHGKAPKILPWGQEQIDEAYKDPSGMGAVKVGYASYWTRGAWTFDKNLYDEYDAAPSLEELARQYL